MFIHMFFNIHGEQNSIRVPNCIIQDVSCCIVVVDVLLCELYPRFLLFYPTYLKPMFVDGSSYESFCLRKSHPRLLIEGWCSYGAHPLYIKKVPIYTYNALSIDYMWVIWVICDSMNHMMDFIGTPVPMDVHHYCHCWSGYFGVHWYVQTHPSTL